MQLDYIIITIRLHSDYNYITDKLPQQSRSGDFGILAIKENPKTLLDSLDQVDIVLVPDNFQNFQT